MADDLKNPFARVFQPPASNRPANCPELVEPIHDISGVRYYVDGRSSVVDKHKQEANRERAQPALTYLALVARQTASALVSADSGQAECVLNLLYHWAKDRALFGNFNAQGYGYRRWLVNALALNFLSIRDAAQLSPEKISEVEKWFRELGADLIRTDAGYENNLLYWSAAAVGATAIAANEPKLFQWAMTKARSGIDEIDATGALPREARRGERAMRYHAFALEPLMELAVLAKANGIDLFAVNDRGLERLVRLVVRNIDKPEEVARLAGVAQDWPTSGSYRSAWTVPYFTLTGDCSILAISAGEGPIVRYYMGGRLDLLYRTSMKCGAP